MSANDDDSWEVRAFEKDTHENELGCTWPPRSYVCTFCRREFRSAQALGGHMNVHRRDRVKLHEVSALMPTTSAVSHETYPSGACFIPGQELVANGLCLVYSMPNPGAGVVVSQRQTKASREQRHVTAWSAPTDKSAEFSFQREFLSLSCQSSNTDPSALNGLPSLDEDIDLELRLGRKYP